MILVSGGDPLSGRECAAADRVSNCPRSEPRDAGFKVLVDAAGRPIDEKLQTARRSALVDVFEDEEPDALLIEAFPFGRRAFRFELDALIEPPGRNVPGH